MQGNRGTSSKGNSTGRSAVTSLWYLELNSIKRQNRAEIYSLGYADDILVLLAGKLKLICELMPEYSKLFTRRRRIPENLNLPTLNGMTIALSNKVKYLDLYLDKNQIGNSIQSINTLK